MFKPLPWFFNCSSCLTGLMSEWMDVKCWEHLSHIVHVLLLGQRSKRDGPLLLFQRVSRSCLKSIEMPQMALVSVVFRNFSTGETGSTSSFPGVAGKPRHSNQWLSDRSRSLLYLVVYCQVRGAVEHPLGYLMDANPKPQRGYRIFRTLETIYFCPFIKQWKT